MKGRLKGLLIFILAVIMSLAGVLVSYAAYNELPTTTVRDNGSDTTQKLQSIGLGVGNLYGTQSDLLHRFTITYDTVNGVRVPTRGDIAIRNGTNVVFLKAHELSSSECDYRLIKLVTRDSRVYNFDLRCGGYGAVEPKKLFTVSWLYDESYYTVQDDSGHTFPVYIHIIDCRDTNGDGICEDCGYSVHNHVFNGLYSWVYLPDFNEEGLRTKYYHLQMCDCGYILPNSPHLYCTNGDLKYSDKNHWYVCSECGGQSFGLISHTFSSYVAKDDMYHTRVCEKCSYRQTESHVFENGVCTVCGRTGIYTVKFSINGSIDSFWTKTAKPGESVNLPDATFVKDGYDFIGWSLSEGGEVVATLGTSTYTPTASVTLYAAWKRKEYTIKYSLQGGSGTISNQQVTAGQAVTITSTKPTRQYYDFKGWSTSASGSATIQPGSSYTPTGNVTLYAIWEKSTYTISFDANGGTGTYANVTVTGGNKVTMPSTNPYRTGYNFKGWTDTRNGNSPMAAGAAYTPTKSMTFYAKWEAKKYTITFDKIEPVPASITVTYDQPIGALPASPTSGWRIAETNENVTSTTVFQVDQNVTLIPRDDKVYVTVTWISDGNATVVQMEKGQKTSPPFIPDSTGGYVFKWWSASSNGPEFNFDNAITSDMTFYAIVEGEKITITFLGIGPKTYTYPQAFGTLPEYSQPGVTFVGWFWDEAMTQKVSPTETVPAYPVTLYPKTEQIKHKLTLPGYGEIMVPEGGAVPDLPTPTREGETFLGWYTPNGVKIKKGDTVTWTTDMTLTPQFAAVEYMVTMPNGEIRKVYSGQPIGTIPTGSISSGTKVVGFKDQNGNWVDKNTTVTSNMRITAVIERNKCVLTLKDGDKVISTHQVEAGLRVTDLPKQTKDGYTFRGWSTMPGGTVTTGPFYTDTELYPVFSANKQPIYLPDLNQTIEKQTGTKIGGLPIPVKEGYEFDGWLWNGKKVTADTEVPAGGMTLTPSWTKIVVDTTRVVKIRYWSDGIRINTVDMNPGEILYDPGTPALSDLNERLFCYWALSNGSPYTFGVRVNSDLDLYAVWK